MFGILILIWILSLVFCDPMFQFFRLYFDFESKQNIHVLKVLIWDLENAGGSFLGFGILILIWILSLVSIRSMFRILDPYLDFEGAKNIHVL